MSMMRLLSAGRSLMGGRQPGKRLQMVDVRSLPKFGTNAKLSSFKVPPSVRDQSPSIKEGNAEKAPGTKHQAPEKLQESSSKGEIRTGKAVSSALGKRMVGKLKSFFSRREKAAVRPVPQPVQGELSLDNVKVLRNDLSDTDFEVVTKAAQKPTAHKAAVKPVEQAIPAAAAGESKKIWNRVTTLIGAGQS